jgi:hypothetical protein
MPFFINGWIEVTRDCNAVECIWDGAIDLSCLVDVADEDSERLFGLAKGSDGKNSVAANRGIPLNVSRAVRQELQDIAALDAEFGTGNFGGYTHATWEELRNYELAEPEGDSEWKLVFDLIRQLEQRFKPSGIRIIIWFNW